MSFKLHAQFKPTGDQPQAIKKLVAGLEGEKKWQVLMGITGSGKTATLAWIIEKTGLPALVISPNKTLAAQLFQEFREFFPDNAVHYFVSYYDYYQPEAYLPGKDIYIEKDAKINEEIDRLRHAATQSVLTREDVIIVSSVSCIYGIGSPEQYQQLALLLTTGQQISISKVIDHLVSLQYRRQQSRLTRGEFRVRGGVVEVASVFEESILRIIWQQDAISRIERIAYHSPHHQDTPIDYSFFLSSPELAKKTPLAQIRIFPAKHFVTPSDKLELAIVNIEAELVARLQQLESQKKLLEAQRLEQRTRYDIEMLREVGYVNGIENYERHINFRAPGQPPETLLDYFRLRFGSRWLTAIDESHLTIPQIRGMYEGDRSRKMTLVEHGFRLPSALDHRPLRFKEFEELSSRLIAISATPGPYELKQATQGRIASLQDLSRLYQKQKSARSRYLNIAGLAEQLIRPTGLLDPAVEIRPTSEQVDGLLKEIRREVKNKGRVLVLTITKRLAEDIAEYLKDRGFQTTWLHSELPTLERPDVLKQLRTGETDVIVGINLLREGLDLPEVSLVAILDADQEGFLRNEVSLIQTIGRAARHPKGRAILFADEITPAIKTAIEETRRRRQIQLTHNKTHHITPQQIIKPIRAPLIRSKKESGAKMDFSGLALEDLKRKMQEAAGNLEFEKAAKIRDYIRQLEKQSSNK